MKLGFDAKRAFLNATGLGHYSRTLIDSLANGYPEHEYWLFTPKTGPLYQPQAPNIKTVIPIKFPYKKMTGLWRLSGVKNNLLKCGIDLYHGLSHELPMGIQHMPIPSVVTMHDLIFERYPNQFNSIDVFIYGHKFRHACKQANRVIAISKQTADDLMLYYKTPIEKIDICYQSCNQQYYKTVTEAEKVRVRKLYQLPEAYMLSVGSIIERKNLLGICQAMVAIPKSKRLPLVVIGSGKAYKAKVETYIKEQNLQNWIIFLNDTAAAASINYKNSADFPAIYQMANGLIYPSFFEGWGIPVLEAMAGGVPVITSNQSSMPEIAGDTAYYIDPASSQSIADAILSIQNNPSDAKALGIMGQERAQLFTADTCALGVMEVYKKTLG